jgi:hypothetical protein
MRRANAADHDAIDQEVHRPPARKIRYARAVNDVAGQRTNAGAIRQAVEAARPRSATSSPFAGATDDPFAIHHITAFSLWGVCP